ncbi:MAG: RiPP maturation radical SAM C-methyltransferase [Acidobacteriota bacterium]
MVQPSALSGGARQARPRTPRVLLAELPFRAARMPSLAFGLLKALGQREGFQVDVAHFDLHFALRFTGMSAYSFVADAADGGLGEWIFSEAVFGDGAPRGAHGRSFGEYLAARDLDAEQIELVERLRAMVPAFLRHCEATVDWSAYDLVGFTTTCSELTPALALARRLRARHPHLRFLLGGAQCEGEMGEEILARFPEIDYVFSGEADVSWPRFLHAWSPEGVEPIPGIFSRDAGAAEAPRRPAPRAQLDTLPTPDYSDYFRCLGELGGGSDDVLLMIEGSRGCWWGEHSHCTFCGLNGTMMAYRQKDPERVVGEIEELVERHRHFQFSFADNILDYDAHKDLLPLLADADYPLKLFAEVKVNLKRPQLELMQRAGIDSIQPGIESLSTSVLALMRKGVNALQNVQLLKWSEELRIVVFWNLLMGFPGESDDDYAVMLDLLESVTHLQPPQVATPLRLDRFSPYYTEARAAHDGEGASPFRLRGPAESYFHTLALPPESIERLAYHFEYDLDIEMPEERMREVRAFVERWRDGYRPQSLVSLVGRDFLRIDDRRFNRVARSYTFGPREKAIYLACGEITTAKSVAATVALEAHGGFDVGAKQVGAFLDSLVGERLVAREGSRYLALAVPWDPAYRNFFDLVTRNGARPFETQPPAGVPEAARQEPVHAG